MKIIAISGSLRENSYNTSLLQAATSLAPKDMQIEIAKIGDLPLFNQDIEMSSFPSAAQALKDKVIAADGIIIATPEYNRSIPGVLKNAIDWISRPYGKNSFAKKPILIMGISVGKTGTAIAQTHLRQIFSHLDSYVIGQPEIFIGPALDVFDEMGNFIDEPSKALIIKGLETLKKRIA